MEKQIKGFTLIELLAVVLIIGILAAVAVPQYEKAVVRARMMQNITRVKVITQAAQLYFISNGQRARDIRDLGAGAAYGAVKFAKGNWTEDEQNISAYYKDGSNCGPNASGGAACVGGSFFIYTKGPAHEFYCRGYDRITDEICRSLGGGKPPAIDGTGNQMPTYIIKF